MDQSPAAAAQRLAFNKWALISAVSTGDIETVVDLLDGGVPIDTKDDKGRSLLHWAALGGHVTTMRLLIRRGCDVDSVDGRGLTPLHCAAAMGQTKGVRELIRKGASKSVVAGNCGTPLHQAAIEGHVETAVAMLEEGCPLGVVSSAGATVLHSAAAGSNVEFVRELVGRGCDVNAVEANGCTPLHAAAVCGRTEAVHELIKLGAAKSVVAGRYGTPLHQAVIKGHVETVGALLDDDVSEPDAFSHDFTCSKVQLLDSGIIGTCDSLGRTPVMWALGRGRVDVFKLLISKSRAIFDRDTHLLCTFEHCFVGGKASKLHQFCEASGMRSSGGGLRGALTTLITRGLVDAHKVVCLCAISGDSVFLDDQFIELVASDACAMPAAVKCAKYCFQEGASFISQLRIADENALNPLHMALLSMKCFEMGFAIALVENGPKDHTSFITKLLSHPVLKDTVHENFPNGLSPLDLARQFELHHIATLIEGAGGRPGVWADIPRDVFVSWCSELCAMYPLLKKVCDTSQGGHEAVKKAVMKFLGAQTVERSPPGPWHPNAMLVGGNVDPETDEHEYKSLMVPADKTKKPPPMRPCKDTSEVLKKVVDHSKEINAMLNHHTGGTVHFGIHDDGMVEEGLDLPQAALIDKLQTRVGQLLQEFYPTVQSHFVTIQLVNLANRSEEPTGRWRFDICVTPHDKVVLFSRHQTVAYYRQGGNSEPMPADMLMERLRNE